MILGVHPLWLLWGAAVAVAVALCRSGWGQARPMQLCAVLSLLSHVLIAASVAVVGLPGGSSHAPPEERVRIVRFESQGASDDLSDLSLEEFADAIAPEPTLKERNHSEPSPNEHVSLEAASESTPAPPPAVASTPDLEPIPLLPTAALALSPLEHAPPPEPAARVPSPAADLAKPNPLALAVEPPPEALVPLARNVAEARLEPAAASAAALIVPLTAPPAMPGLVALPSRSAVASARPFEAATPLHRPTPAVYRMRLDPERSASIDQLGGSADTEAAVRRALAWLASQQEPDGSWNAVRHGAGRGQDASGQGREAAGGRADCGVTGLSILAFLGAGHSPLEGEHRAAVSKGVGYLVGKQAPDGNLAGDARLYEFMYCHAMAAFALAECYAMTGDERLAGPVRQALDYTWNAQDRRGGGWRYQPGDAGDMSVFGWQLMALQSGERGGLPIPEERRRLLRRFVQSHAVGSAGGLSSYRMGEAPSASMTAEAWYCRQLLGVDLADAASGEAVDRIFGQLPGRGAVDDYCWYYATLALHRSGGPAWERWNEALQNELVRSQDRAPGLAGSWPPRGAWGGHGGRVYSTAVAALCLEVYYRYSAASGEPAAPWTVRRDSPGPISR